MKTLSLIALVVISVLLTGCSQRVLNQTDAKIAAGLDIFYRAEHPYGLDGWAVVTNYSIPGNLYQVIVESGSFHAQGFSGKPLKPGTLVKFIAADHRAAAQGGPLTLFILEPVTPTDTAQEKQ